MDPNNIKIALAEARRFTSWAEEVLKGIESGRIKGFQPSKDRAALRRASLDLTRALSRMRNG
jgi:hypothetical protein